jgi:hypothetical protein
VTIPSLREKLDHVGNSQLDSKSAGTKNGLVEEWTGMGMNGAQ